MEITPLTLEAPYVVVRDKDSDPLTATVEFTIDHASQEVLFAYVRVEKALNAAEANAIRRFFERTRAT